MAPVLPLQGDRIIDELNAILVLDKRYVSRYII